MGVEVFLKWGRVGKVGELVGLKKATPMIDLVSDVRLWKIGRAHV